MCHPKWEEPMDLTFSDQETAFRDELRGWLVENQPEAEPAADAGDDAQFAYRRDWQRRLYDAGWAAPAWPTEYGGRGSSQSESAIYFEELGRARVPFAANTLGLLLGGPTLMVWGTPEQKERHLPPILSAEEIWCQGFSEPDAGSDLAALKTRAVKDGNEWVVTGRRCGRAAPSTRSGACSWRAPTTRWPSTRALRTS